MCLGTGVLENRCVRVQVCLGKVSVQELVTWPVLLQMCQDLLCVCVCEVTGSFAASLYPSNAL